MYASPATRYRLPNGMEIFQINRNETEYLYKEIFEQREYATEAMKLTDGGVVVDVGANIGMFSLFALAEWRPSRLIAVEPIPALRSVLELNLNKFEQARIVAAGVGRVRENSSFTYYPGYSLMSGRYCDPARDLEMAKSYARWENRSLPADEREAFEESLDDLLEFRFATVTEQVEVRPLWHIFEEHGLDRIDLLKIDAEGSELDILRGIRDEDWPMIKNLVVEIDEERAALSEATGIIKAHGMECDLCQDDAYRETSLHLIYAHR